MGGKRNEGRGEREKRDGVEVRGRGVATKKENNRIRRWEEREASSVRNGRKIRKRQVLRGEGGERRNRGREVLR